VLKYRADGIVLSKKVTCRGVGYIGVCVASGTPTVKDPEQHFISEIAKNTRDVGPTGGRLEGVGRFVSPSFISWVVVCRVLLELGSVHTREGERCRARHVNLHARCRLPVGDGHLDGCADVETRWLAVSSRLLGSFSSHLLFISIQEGNEKGMAVFQMLESRVQLSRCLFARPRTPKRCSKHQERQIV